MLTQTIGERSLQLYTKTVPIPEEQTIAEMWIYLQKAIVALTNFELAEAQKAIAEVKEANSIQVQMHQEAVVLLSQQIFGLQQQLQLALDDEGAIAGDAPLESMDWQPEAPINMLPYGAIAEKKVQEGIAKGILQRVKGKGRSGGAASVTGGGTASEQLRDEDAQTPHKRPGPSSRVVATPQPPTTNPWGIYGLDFNAPPPDESAPAAEQIAYYKMKALCEKILGLEKAARDGKPSGQREVKAPDPKTFKGEPEDLERFLVQLDNKFQLSSHMFRTDMHKIQYAANLLEGDVARWYETYHLKISSQAAARLGIPFARDPVYETWVFFEEKLRASFGSSLTREQAVLKWMRLRHTGSIDSFLDEFTRLMWKVGYSGDEVKDKLAFSLNEELGKRWSELREEVKPLTIEAQVAKVRDMGHALERYEKMRGQLHSSSSRKDHGRRPKNLKERITKGPPGAKSSSPGPKEGKEKGRGNGKEKRPWKDKETELGGIPQGLLDKRASQSQCLKCGKENHTWVQCTAPKNTGGQNAGSSGKRKAPEGESSGSAPKKAKPAGQSSASLNGIQPPGRLMVIDEAEDSDLEDLDIQPFKE